MLYQLTEFLFDHLNIILVIAIFGLVIWVYLYIVQYSDWFRNLLKKPEPSQIERMILTYFKLRVEYLSNNINKIPVREILIELNMIVRYYLSIIERIKVNPGDTFSEVSKKMKKPSKHTGVLLGFMKGFEQIKYQESNKLSKAQMRAYLITLHKLMNYIHTNLEQIQNSRNEEKTKEHS